MALEYGRFISKFRFAVNVPKSVGNGNTLNRSVVCRNSDSEASERTWKFLEHFEKENLEHFKTSGIFSGRKW